MSKMRMRTHRTMTSEHLKKMARTKMMMMTEWTMGWRRLTRKF